MVNRHHFFKNSYISQLSLKKVQKSQILCKISKVKIDPLIHSISNVSEDWHWPGCVPWTSRSHWMEKTGISFKVLFVSQKRTKKIHAKSAHRRIPFQMSQKVDIALDNGQWGHIFRCNESLPVGGKREGYHLPPPWFALPATIGFPQTICNPSSSTDQTLPIPTMIKWFVIQALIKEFPISTAIKLFLIQLLMK